jgi:hypothetical protein
MKNKKNKKVKGIFYLLEERKEEGKTNNHR